MKIARAIADTMAVITIVAGAISVQATCDCTVFKNWSATFPSFRPLKLRWSTAGLTTEAKWLVFDHLPNVETVAKFYSYRSPALEVVLFRFAFM